MFFQLFQKKQNKFSKNDLFKKIVFLLFERFVIQYREINDKFQNPNVKSKL